MNDFLEKWANESELNRRVCAREDLAMDVTEDILIAMEEKGISKSDLAKSLDKSKSFITQILSGSRNMTLHTLSDICFSLNIQPRISFSDVNNNRCINGENHKFNWETDKKYQEEAQVLELVRMRKGGIREKHNIELTRHKEDTLKYA